MLHLLSQRRTSCNLTCSQIPDYNKLNLSYLNTPATPYEKPLKHSCFKDFYLSRSATVFHIIMAIDQSNFFSSYIAAKIIIIWIFPSCSFKGFIRDNNGLEICYSAILIKRVPVIFVKGANPSDRIELCKIEDHISSRNKL